MHGGGTAVIATEDEPRETGWAAGLRSSPTISMHHGQAIPEHVESRESAVLEQFGTSSSLEERQPGQHDHGWT
jgi:hypothetical protein